MCNIKLVKLPQLSRVEGSTVEDSATEESLAPLPNPRLRQFSGHDLSESAPSPRQLKRRPSRDVIGLDLESIPQTRVRSHEVVKEKTGEPSPPTFLASSSRRKKSPRVRKPVRSQVIEKLVNVTSNLESINDESDSTDSRPRRGSAPHTPTRKAKLVPPPSPGTPYTNQRLLKVSPKSPLYSPQADKLKAPKGEIRVL
jgi:hypothetical protein